MKKTIKNIMYAGLFSMALIFNSCSIEFDEVNGGNEEQPIAAGSPIASLIKNTSAKDGSFDNIVDCASCVAINFPYTVEVAEFQITIDSKEDLQLIEDIFDEFDNDEDILEIRFPITITLDDFTEIVIENMEALRELVAECTEGEDDDIECIDFVYPITLFTFDINEQKTGEVVINSDEQLRRFFAGLNDDDLVSINFPITLKKFDGTEINIFSNTELAIALETAKNVCDEDDDNDFNDDDFTKERLDAYLAECPWLVREVKRNGTDQTDQYFEYLMNFTENGIVTVINSTGIMLTGAWETNTSDNGVVLDLEFETLADFTLQWLVYDIGEDRIKLFGDDNNKIILKQLCEGGNGNNENTLREILKECEWIIAKLSCGNPEFDLFFHGIAIDFVGENNLGFSFGDGNYIYDDGGFWEVGANEENDLILDFRFNENFPEKEWVLADSSETRLRFTIEELDYEFILERICEDDTLDSDEAAIISYISDGLWSVASYIENTEDLTDQVGVNTLEFQNENNLVSVTYTNGETGVEGTWRVMRNSLGELKLFLAVVQSNPGDNLVLSLSGNWSIEEATPNQIKLAYEDENFVKSLILEKQ